MPKAQLSIEKRRHPRVTVTLPVNFKVINRASERERILSEAARDEAEATNLSAGGVAMATPQSLKKGDLVKLEINLPNQPSPIRTFAEVMWVRPHEGHEHLIGLQFLAVRGQDEDLLAVFVGNLLRGGAS